MAENTARLDQEVTILLAEDDLGHAKLIEKNLRRAGISNQIIHFEDGQQVLDYLFQKGDGPKRNEGEGAYVLFLDIRMPKADGLEVLRQVKKDPALRAIPIIVLTTADDPREVKHCYELGCNLFITKPVKYQAFVDVLQHVATFLLVVRVPEIN